MSWTARLLEDLRQWVLVGELGQVPCDDWHHEPDIMVFGDCQACGAAL